MHLTVGYRIYNMFPFLLLTFLSCFVLKESKNIATLLLILGSVLTIAMNWYFPFPTFENVKTSGKFDVGLRQFRVKNTGNLISVFYPAKKNSKTDFLNFMQFGEA